jgi:NAD(P)-dependent dehydrogenase (short-subunit alcohol dehydrogenase family)
LREELDPLGISVTVVEPGAFRTDFAGRSLTQSAAPIADYAKTAGRRRIENDSAHGTQPGDPAKAAEAIIAAVQAPHPPYLLLLGADAVDAYRAVADAQRNEVEQWRELSLGTGLSK